MSKWILKSNKRISPQMVGQKAANLAFLLRQGFNVPQTAFVVVHALRAFLEANRLLSQIAELKRGIQDASQELNVLQSIRERIEQGRVMPSLENQVVDLLTAWEKKGITALAVRSSAVNEDLGRQSFAGQYFTALHVPLEKDAVLKAVKQVWASLFSEAAWTYCRKHELSLPESEMGVILQAMIPAQYSGVVFSQNPLADASEEMLIEFVSGTGDQLVDGKVVPRQYRFNRENLRTGRLAADLKNADLPNLETFINEIIRLERLTGAPVDVEWAVTNEQYYFLQYRPITTETKAIIWSDENVGEVIPDVVTPFSWSILKPMTNGAYRYFLRRVGLRFPNDPLFALHLGKVYFNQNAFRNLLESFYLSTYLNPEKNKVQVVAGVFRLLYLLFRLNIFLLRLPHKAARMQKLLVDDIPQAESIHSAKGRMKKMKLLIRRSQKIMNAHIAVTIFGEIFYQALDKLCQEWCATQEIKASKLLQGIGEVASTRPARALWEIGRWVRLNETYRKKFTMLSPQELQEWIAGMGPGDPLRKAIDLFFTTYGYGALHEFELLYPRWEEDPAFIFQTLRSYALAEQNGFNLQKHLSLLAKEKNTLKQKALQQLQGSAVRRTIFKYLLKKAEYFSFEREILKQNLVRHFARLKEYLTVISNQYFGDAQSIFYLTWPEVKSLLAGRLGDKELTLKIQQRKLLRDEQMKLEHPGRLKQVGSRWIPLRETEEDENKLKGIACSAGVVEGKVQVILQAEQGAEFEKGNILVTKATNPGWTPLMVLAGGIITEIGGALSHGAIIAREFGIPMVAAVKDATNRLKTGQWIRMDGQTGTIELLDEDED